jgi:hypothetical protein
MISERISSAMFLKLFMAFSGTLYMRRNCSVFHLRSFSFRHPSIAKAFREVLKETVALSV